MADASGVKLRFQLEEIPFVNGAHRYASDFIFPGGASDNRLYFQKHVQFSRKLAEEEIMLLFDPQTSGGLLIAVPGENLEGLMARAEEIGQPLWVVGEALEGNGIEIV